MLIEQILWYFLIFSFLGWCAEVVVASVRKKKVVNRGFFIGPFCPIYGLSIVISNLLLRHISSAFFVLTGGIIIAITIQLVTGYLMKKFLHIRSWDYSHLKLNLKGNVYLPLSFLFGLLIMIIIRWILPLIDKLMAFVPNFVELIVFIAASVLILLDIISAVAIGLKLKKQAKSLKNVTDKILNARANGGSEADIEKLKEEYEIILNQTNIFTRRFVNVFPNIDSQKYSREIKSIKERLLNNAEKLKEKNDFEYEHTFQNDEIIPFAYGLNFKKLFWLFFIGCFLGCIIEELYSFVTLGYFEVRVGLVYGPFIPVYGGGAVAITLALYKLHKKSDLVIFAVSAVVGAAFEYFSSLFQEKLFGTVSWDYSDTFLNIDGRTNLMYAIMWGILGLLWIRYLYPFVSRQIGKIPKHLGRILTVALCVFMVFDIFMSCAALIRRSNRDNGVPSSNFFEAFLDDTLNDEYLDVIFPNMKSVEEIGVTKK